VAPFNPDPSLVVTSGAGPARQIPISFRGVVLGRDVRFGAPFSTDEFVSRSHVWVRRRGDGVEVTDLGSANGTYVNGTRVRAPTLMQDSDVLRIGQIHLKLAAPGEPDRPVATTLESSCVPRIAPHRRKPGRGQRPPVLPVRGQPGGRA
jgi:pSer/pThr/pTyr-binding forkhead associated (FHA) protein